MLKLILKDFVIQRKNMKTYIIIAVFFALFFSFTGQQQMVLSIAIFPIIYGFLNRALYEDEKNNTLRLLVSLPISRETIVQARYISIGIFTVIVTVVFVIIDKLLILSGIWKGRALMDVATTAAIIMVFLVMISVYLPIAFKLGYIKAASINRFILIGVFAFFGAFTVVAGQIFKGPLPEFIKNIDVFLSSLNPVSVLIIAVVVILVLYYASMELSIKFFKRRNLFK